MNSIINIEQWLFAYWNAINFDLGLKRVSYFLKQLWNPQYSYKVIHVAGTSGKGTTCWMMSHCLSKLWYRVGLTMSPHILDIRERCMINGQLISEELFVQYMNIIRDVIDITDWFEIWKPSYFEIMIVAALYIFAQEWVEYTILETWLGGRLDATNVVESPDKICVITSIGYDHQKFLWDTLEEISTEKTMIVHAWNPCFTYHQEPIIDITIDQVVKEQWWTIYWVDNNHHYPLMPHFLWQHNQLNMSVVDWVLRYLYAIWLIQQDVDSIELMRDCSPLLARMHEIQYWTNMIIIDGAHNTQKMSALIQWLEEKFWVNQKYVFILALKEDKNVEQVLQIVLPKAIYILATEFGDLSQDYPIRAVSVDSIMKYCREYHRYIYCQEELNHKTIVDLINQNQNHIIIITWSFYLASSFIKLLS